MEQPKSTPQNDDQQQEPAGQLSSMRHHDVVKLQPNKQGASARGAGYKGILQLIVGSIIIAFIVNRGIFQSYEVFGQSMTPTLQQSDRLIVSKVGKTYATFTRSDYIPRRGTIIVFTNPLDDKTQLIKRVIGLPGERVVVKDGLVTIYNDENPNGFNPDANYQDNIASYTSGNQDVVVKEGTLFVSGDNRNPGGSLDSRNELGLVPEDNIIGELVLRILPIDNASVF